MGYRGVIAVCSVVVIVAVSLTNACASDDRASQPTPVTTGGWVDDGVEQLLDAAVAVRVSACRPLVERGTGLVVEAGRILTSAHVVAGATAIWVFTHRGEESDAAIIAFDPINDLAVLAVDIDLGTPLPMASVPPDGPFKGQAVFFRQDQPVVETIEVTRRVNINTEDIYRSDPVTRPGYEIRANIRAGDSGGAIVRDGEAVAVIWSKSRVTSERGWAIDPIRGGETVRQQVANGMVDDGIELDRCS